MESLLMPKGFQDKDIIYHYTSAETAIQHILFSDSLRLSPRLRSNDPIEKKGFSIGGMTTQLDDEKSRALFKRTDGDAKFINDKIDDLVRNAKQLCFCENYYSPGEFALDHYGFLKPRMWDQYGENFRGVCLAYSKSKLLEDNKITHYGNVKYIDYSILQTNFDTINHDSLDGIRKNEYINNVMKRVDETFFQKHKDYRDEREFRFLNFSSNEYEFISTKDALVGIFFSPYLMNNYYSDQLHSFANQKNSDLVYLNWTKNGVEVSSEKTMNNIIAGKF